MTWILTERKYWKPASMTWWASVAPLLAGVFMAFAPVHGMTALTESLREVFSGASAGALINIGLAGIGIRGAVK